MKPLDIVSPKLQPDIVGLIREVSTSQNISTCAIVWFGKQAAGMKVAWWDKEEINIIDNIPNVLTRSMAHPMGNNHRPEEVAKHFPITGM